MGGIAARGSSEVLGGGGTLVSPDLGGVGTCPGWGGGGPDVVAGDKIVLVGLDGVYVLAAMDVGAGIAAAPGRAGCVEVAEEVTETPTPTGPSSTRVGVGEEPVCKGKLGLMGDELCTGMPAILKNMRQNTYSRSRTTTRIDLNDMDRQQRHGNKCPDVAGRTRLQSTLVNKGRGDKMPSLLTSNLKHVRQRRDDQKCLQSRVEVEIQLQKL